MALRLFPVRARTIVVGLLVCSAATTTFASTLAAQSRAGGGAGTSRTEPSPRRFTEPPIARRASTSDALSPTDAESLESDIGWLLNSRIRNGTWGAMVVSLSRGDTLYNQNAGEHLLPASTMKLFTAALAFDRLGPGYELSTEILRDGNLRAKYDVIVYPHVGGSAQDRPFSSFSFKEGIADILPGSPKYEVLS